METYQKMLDSFLQSEIEELFIGFVCKKIKESGLVLNSDQIEKIRKAITEHRLISDLNLSFNESQVDSSINKLTTSGNVSVSLDDSSELEKSVNDLLADFPNIINNESQNIATVIFDGMNKNFGKYYKWTQKEKFRFEKDLKNIWGEPILLLEMLLVISHECRDAFSVSFSQEAEKDNDYVFVTLVRLHARACQIGMEILTLIKNGFADGAHARWRTLHEIAVTSMFINQHGNDVAERYIFHDIIQRFKLCEDYKNYSEQLHMPKVEDDELGEIQEEYNNALARFGNSFKHDYGWAANELEIKRPTFKDIEKAVAMDSMRPYYTLACQNVHANVRAAFFKLGIPDNPEILLAGPSMYGLEDPGQGAALSLMQTTTALLTCRPTFDTLIYCSVIKMLYEKIANSFVVTEQNLDGCEL